jgi:hypothetical protein
MHHESQVPAFHVPARSKYDQVPHGSGDDNTFACGQLSRRRARHGSSLAKFRTNIDFIKTIERNLIG